MASRIPMLLLMSTMMLISLSFVQIADAAASLRLLDPNPDHPGKCVLAEKNIILGVGESMNIQGECATATCRRSEDSNNFILSYIGCGLVMQTPGCSIVENNQRPHPDCCPRVVCPN